MWFKQLADSNQLDLESGTYADIEGKAIFNTYRTRRYFLEKRWAEEGTVLTAIMMNPSSASHDETDDSVDQLIDLAKNQGCYALHVVNISSIIDGTSNNLNNAHFAYEMINWNFISTAMTEANVIFLGWGMKGQLGMLGHQSYNSNLVNAFQNVSSKIYCYDVLKSTNKKFIKRPVYYVPHPRPQTDKEKYRDVPIRQITDLEFIQLFFR
ncbi:DUF1643 domain-containing protein [Bacillus sp. V5-8f]|uniref:DUF1643 domain-containing protein n=1 Tax=Bacillus sp. V5-8f TaxID=2053044 RepID=UPI0015E0C48E|nr:DUF1643 domain-containing protein [Bacillus sp. V5-8f]